MKRPENNDKTQVPNWWRKIRVPNLCEWQILKKIARNGGKLTRYYLAKYSKTCGECDEIKMTEYKIDKLLSEWKKYGLIELKPAYESSPIKLPSMTQKGKEFINIVGVWFDSPTT